MFPTVTVDSWKACTTIVAGFIFNFIFFGYQGSYISMQDGYVSDLEVKKETVTHCFWVATNTFGPLAIVSDILCKRFTIQKTVVLGSSVSAVAMLILSLFFTDSSYVLLLQGYVVGFCISLGYVQTISLVGVSFKKFRGIAVGVCFTGSSIGRVLLPKLTSIFVEAYTIRGAIFIWSSILLHLWLAACFLPDKVLDDCTGKIILSYERKRPAENPIDIEVSVDSLRRRIQGMFREYSLSKLKSLVTWMKISLTILRKSLAFLSAYSVASFVFYNQIYLAADFGREKRVIMEGGQYRSYIEGGINFICRLLAGFVMDHTPKAGIVTLYGAVSLIQAINIIFLSILPTFTSFLIFHIVIGFTDSVFTSLLPLMLCLYIDTDLLKDALILTFAVQGFVSFCLDAVIEALSSIDGFSLTYVLIIYGFLLLASASTLFIKTLITCVRKRMMTMRSLEDEEELEDDFMIRFIPKDLTVTSLSTSNIYVKSVENQQRHSF